VHASGNPIDPHARKTKPIEPYEAATENTAKPPQKTNRYTNQQSAR
jgi:hypothetical protein